MTLHRLCDYNDLITVLVGSKETPFTVHKDSICAKSKLFKAACSKHRVEGQKKVVRLPEAIPSVFRRYLLWAYSGHLEWTADGKIRLEAPNEADQEAIYEEMSMIIELYILGDSLDDIRLRNKVVEILATGVGYVPNGEQLTRLWANTTDNSLLRTMFTDRLVLRADRSESADSESADSMSTISRGSHQADRSVFLSAGSDDLPGSLCRTAAGIPGACYGRQLAFFWQYLS